MSSDAGKLSDRLRDALEEDILTGALSPGDRLEEIALAARFGVSRTPIREALLSLAAAGLAEIRPRRGAVVAEIGPRRLMEMFEVMAELEGLCARLAARRADLEEIAAIRACHEACAAAISDVDAYYYRNETFHERIRAAGRNRFLFDQADALQKRLRPYRRLQLRARDRIAASLAEHAAIVAALEAGDGAAAAQAMRAHVAVQGERFADLLSSLDGSARLRA
jgi:DNA-binding GntR family transcriptional regulator